MRDLNLKNVDPRLMSRVADHIGSATQMGGTASDRIHASAAGIERQMGMSAPMMMPMAAPGPSGSYNRYREMTLEEMLLENRVIFLIGEINHGSAARVYMQMLYLQSQKKDSDINLYINSPGGHVTDTLAIYDVMRYLQCDTATYCIGEAASGGAIALMAGTKGKRYILPNAKVMIHQPFGGVYGQAADIQIQAEQILKDKENLVDIMARCTGQPKDKLREDSERDRFFTAPEALSYGLIDEILGENSAEVEKK